MKTEIWAEQEAANDPVAPISRTAPIKSTLTPIPGYPKTLVLFKMQASQYWQVRCYMRGKVHRLSTHSTSIKVAEHTAKRIYEELLLNRAGSPFKSKEDFEPYTWFEAANQLIQQEWARVQRKEFSKGSWQVLKNRVFSVLNPFFGNTALSAVSSLGLVDLLEQLSSKYSSITVHQYLVIVRKVFTLAKKLGHIDVIPDIPSVKVKGQSRGAFTPTEYYQLIRRTRSMLGHKHPLSEQELRLSMRLRAEDCCLPVDLSWVIGFLVHGFMRPSDLKFIRHKHVEVIVKPPHTYLRLTLPETKKHGAPIVTLPSAVRIYRNIVKHQKQLGQAAPNDYLFMPHLRDRDHMLKVLSVHFNWVLQETGLKLSPNGTQRTLYSLRHSAITFRLLYGSGVDLLTLAKNARTSVDMIERHYASTLQAEQNIAMLHSRRT